MSNSNAESVGPLNSPSCPSQVSPLFCPRCRFRAHSRPFGADARVFGSRNNVLPRVRRRSVRKRLYPQTCRGPRSPISASHFEFSPISGNPEIIAVICAQETRGSMGNSGMGIAAVSAGAEHQVRRPPISPVIWPRCRIRAHSRPFGADARVFGSRNNVLPRVRRRSVRTKSHPANRLLLSCLECKLGRQCRRSISAAIISPAARYARSQFLLLGCCIR